MNFQIHQLSFSPHTDAKGIMDLVKFLSPQHVILVHGEKPKMASLKKKIHSELGITCYDPANNESVYIPSTNYVKAGASDAFMQSCMNPNFKFLKRGSEEIPNASIQRCTKALSPLQVSDERVVEGILIMEKSKKAKVVHQDELLLKLGAKRHEVQFAYCCPVSVEKLEKTATTDLTPATNVSSVTDKCILIKKLFTKLSSEFSVGDFRNLGEYIRLESFQASICSKDSCPYRITNSFQNKSKAVFFCCTWSGPDEKLAWKIISTLENAI